MKVIFSFYKSQRVDFINHKKKLYTTICNSIKIIVKQFVHKFSIVRLVYIAKLCTRLRLPLMHRCKTRFNLQMRILTVFNELKHSLVQHRLFVFTFYFAMPMISFVHENNSYDSNKSAQYVGLLSGVEERREKAFVSGIAKSAVLPFFSCLFIFFIFFLPFELNCSARWVAIYTFVGHTDDDNIRSIMGTVHRGMPNSSHL